MRETILMKSFTIPGQIQVFVYGLSKEEVSDNDINFLRSVAEDIRKTPAFQAMIIAVEEIRSVPAFKNFTVTWAGNGLVVQK